MKYRLVKEYPRSPKLGTILEFNMGWEDTQAWIESNPLASREFWEEIKEPIFATQDGKDIYYGDSYYKVKLANFDIFQIVSAMKGGGNMEGYNYFSTKEAAEKWIDENKPRYSKNDVKAVIEESFNDCYNDMRQYSFLVNVDLANFYLHTVRNKLHLKLLSNENHR